MSFNFQMAIRSFTRSVLLKTGRNMSKSPSGNSLENQDDEICQVTLIFVSDNGEVYRTVAKEGECLCDFAEKLGFKIDDPVKCVMAERPLHYYADNIFFNNLPGPGQSKLDEELTQLFPRQKEFEAKIPISKDFDGFFVPCSSNNQIVKL
uniref:Uncharacterized protein n=1 Tax=Panagrolaimus sp. JU765 TaxID=591449 RepID=A0AC34PUD1_9BILA